MKVADLTLAELRARLRTDGLCLPIGPFVYRIRSPQTDIAEAMHRLYEAFSIETAGVYADFHVHLEPVLGGRWLRRGCQLYVDGVSYYVPFPAHRAFAYLEWGMNRCVYDRAQPWLIGHAAALERRGKAMMLMGMPGAGKSTLCAALSLSGWRLLSDELSLIDCNTLDLSGLARPVILKNESIDLIRARADAGAIGPLQVGTGKGTVAHLRPPVDSVRRVGETASPGWLVFVSYTPGSRLELRPVSKAQAMIRFAKSSFNYGDLGRRGFETLSEVIDRCQCFHLVYSDLGEAIERFGSDEFLEAHQPVTSREAS